MKFHPDYYSYQYNAWMDGGFDFTSFLTVFQLYQDDGRIIMTGCVPNVVVPFDAGITTIQNGRHQQKAM